MNPLLEPTGDLRGKTPGAVVGTLPAAPLRIVTSLDDYGARHFNFTIAATDPIAPYTYSPSEKAIRIAREAKSLGLKNIHVEQPVGWLKLGQDRCGDVHRQMFANLVVLLSQLDLSLKLTPVYGRQHFIPRTIEDGEIRISYHSVGNENGIWRLKESYLPPYYTFDRSGFSGWGELAKSEELFKSSKLISADDATSYYQSLRDSVNSNRVTKYAQLEISEDPLPEKYVFHAMQIPTDPVNQFTRINYIELLTNLIDLANSTDVPLVIKRHPLCQTPEVDQLITKIKGIKNIIISQGNIHQLISGAQGVVVINSGVGMEAALQGKPVYTAGLSDYRWCTNEVSNRDDLSQAFLAPENKLSEVEHAQFITYYFRHYCMDASNPVSVEKHVTWALLQWIDAQANRI